MGASKQQRLKLYQQGVELLHHVAASHNLSVRTLRGPERFPHIVRARKDFCVAAKKMGIGPVIAGKILWRHCDTVRHHTEQSIQDAHRRRDLVRRGILPRPSNPREGIEA